jgi:hypothetical protein
MFGRRAVHRHRIHGSRGPFIGWFAGAFLFTLLGAGLAPAQIDVGIRALGMVGLVWAVTTGPLGGRSMPYGGMLGHLADSEFSTGKSAP